MIGMDAQALLRSRGLQPTVIVRTEKMPGDKVIGIGGRIETVPRLPDQAGGGTSMRFTASR